MSKIITLTDDPTYSDRMNGDNGLKPGDLLIDTANAQDKIGSYWMGGDWPDLADNSTIWLDGNLIPKGKDFIFRNGPDEQKGWNEVKNITIRPIPGTQINANSFECVDLLNLKMPFYSKDFLGLESLGDKKFLSGNFGMHVNLSDEKGHGYKISVLDGGTAEIEGIEGQGGFAALRFAEGKRASRQHLKLKNFYFHDTDRGEGLYLGQSVGLPACKLTVEISNGFVARTAAELLQAQHLNGSDIHNLTMICGTTAWIAAFEPYQDNGLQFQVDSGVNKLYNIIIDGFASNGIAPLSSDQGEGIKKAELINILLNNGRYNGHYLHNSNSFGVEWLLNKVFYRAFNDSYARTGKPATDYICSKAWGTDVFTFKNCLFDESKARFFEDPADGDIKQANILPPVNYMNSGFIEPMSDIMQYKKFWGTYHPVGKAGQVLVDYSAGQVLIDDRKFYKVRKSFLANDKPLKDNESCQLLTWDENAVRSDMVGFNSASKQREDAPDDLRLKKDDFWKSMGMGYTEPQNVRDEMLAEFKKTAIEFINKMK